MSRIPADYLERVYAGWLGKIIGVRLGAAIEAWDYECIRESYGELDDYPVWYKRFAADDDTTGPLYLFRALEEKQGDALTSQDVADAFLNYCADGHGFIWWGGYGTSTMHNAYVNLKSGMKPPESGSRETNGPVLSEMIAGQIFVDPWGLVAPGRPELAADMAEKASRVTHDGNSVQGGRFVAAAIAAAFAQRDVRRVLETALGQIDPECDYTKVARFVMDYRDGHPDSTWRDCFLQVREHYGYDRYPGATPVVPNAGVMVLSLLYGGGDFEKTLLICANCGWDTDCNVGSLGTLMGVLCGLEGIDYQKWRRPVNDLVIRSGVMGDMNITDIPYGACYIAREGYRLAGEEIPEAWKEVLEHRIHDCHFEFPGSTHALEVRTEGRDNTFHFVNTDEDAYTGKRCLKFIATRLLGLQELYLHRRNYYWKDDFSDSRYDPCFSPLFYPGQTVETAVRLPRYSDPFYAWAYARDSRSGRIFTGEKTLMTHEKWQVLRVTVPGYEGGLIDEAGICLQVPPEKTGRRGGFQVQLFIDDLRYTGQPDYTVDLTREIKEVWSKRHQDVTQFTRLRGTADMVERGMRIACETEGEWYTGCHSWRDYDAAFTMTPESGSGHLALFRVQGALRSYAAGFVDGRFVIQKNRHGYTTLAQAPCPIRMGETVTVSVSVRGNKIEARCAGTILTCEDGDRPYLEGAVGISVRDGSAVVERIRVKGVE